MTQKDKELLLKDLCARLPYGLKVKYAIPTLLVSIRNDRDGIKVITEGTYNEHIYNIEDIKPYLRPLSSMTDEEFHEYNMHLLGITTGVDIVNFMIWIYQHHLDILHFIEKGLALEAPEGMYNNI